MVAVRSSSTIHHNLFVVVAIVAIGARTGAGRTRTTTAVYVVGSSLRQGGIRYMVAVLGVGAEPPAQIWRWSIAHSRVLL